MNAYVAQFVEAVNALIQSAPQDELDRLLSETTKNPRVTSTRAGSQAAPLSGSHDPIIAEISPEVTENASLSKYDNTPA